MNVTSAEKMLVKNNIDPLIYSIRPPKKVKCYVIEEENGQWVTYYWERGLRHSVMYYESETEAVSNFLDNIVEIASLNERRTIVMK